MKNTVFLIMGVSGVGKTTLIKEIISKNPDFTYIKPYTNRPLRSNETDKIFKHTNELKKLELKSGYITNKKFGFLYSISVNDLRYTIKKGSIPIIDWPIKKLEEFEKKLSPIKTFTIYLFPPSISELKQRLKGRVNNEIRYLEALDEIEEVKSTKKSSLTKFYVTENNNTLDIVNDILNNIDS